MKKWIGLGFLLITIMVFSGCSSSEPKSNLTLDTFIKAYTDAGVKVDPNKKQIAQTVGAKNGVIFLYG
ncbi:hypothetical protein PV433_11500 [Paenibacillus sp. GYB004]|uniref:hypothetical protein n=1 Tax=Paenibacillus sp. GYB004 TaxID=2994393 RepID=UPI002F96463C